MEEIASSISGVRPDLVEEVLDEYGDPAEDQTEDTSLEGNQSKYVESTTPDPDELTEKQLEILRAIREHPHAKQRELAELLDIAAPTACNRANSIPGFEWEHRKDFADAVLRQERRSSGNGQSKMTIEIPDSDDQIRMERLADRVRTLEEKFDDGIATDQACPASHDRELALKVIHTVLKSETFTEEEELRILDLLV